MVVCVAKMDTYLVNKQELKRLRGMGDRNLSCRPRHLVQDRLLEVFKDVSFMPIDQGLPNSMFLLKFHGLRL